MTFARAVVLLVVPLLLCTPVSVAQSDTEPPELVDFDFNPKSLDVTQGLDFFTCSITATDAVSGVYLAGCRFVSPSGLHRASCQSFDNPASGDIYSGVWECLAAVGQYQEEGTWVVEFVEFRDNASNYVQYGTSEIQGMGFPTELEVVSSEDLVPPVLVDFDFNPKSLDVTQGLDFFTCSITATDAVSGVYLAGCRFVSPSGLHRASCQSFDNPASGDIYSGVWECLAAVGQYQEEGTWVVEFVEFRDNASNYVQYGTSEIQGMGFPTELEVVSSEDLVPPVLVDFDFNPKSLDVTQGLDFFTCSITATDAVSGVYLAGCRFVSPSGLHRASCQSFDNPASGDIYSGVWECLAAVGQYQEEGTWVVEFVEFRDNASNYVQYGTSEIQGMGFPTNLGVGFVEGQPHAVVSAPRADVRVRGNSVTVRARLAQGSPDNVHPTLGVRFEYRSLPFGDFASIPARNANHPNPDTTYPYFTHWDVSGVADGDYELRAVAHDLDGLPDPSPEFITITIDHAGPVDVDENENAEGLQENHTALDDAVENEAGSGDHTDTSTATDLTIPAGALSNPTDTVILLYPDPALEEPMLEQPEQNLGSFVDVTLESGQTDFEAGATSDLDISYSDRDQDGVVDGTSVREDEVELRYYDPGSGSYVLASGWIVMTEHNMVHADAASTGRFALTGPLQPRCWFEADRITLAWAAVSEATSYNVYRGALADLVDADEDGLPDNGYGDCQIHRDPDTTDAAFVDDEVPVGAGFFYMISFVGAEGETTLGNTSAGLRRWVMSSCP